MICKVIILIGVFQSTVLAQNFGFLSNFGGGGGDLGDLTSCLAEDSPLAALKKLNESCNHTSECTSPLAAGAIVCSDRKVCECAPGFHQTSITDLQQQFNGFGAQFARLFGRLGSILSPDDVTCQPLPTLYQPCVDECATPFQCVGDGDDVDGTDDTDGNDGNGNGDDDDDGDDSNNNGADYGESGTTVEPSDGSDNDTATDLETSTSTSGTPQISTTTAASQSNSTAENDTTDANPVRNRVRTWQRDWPPSRGGPDGSPSRGWSRGGSNGGPFGGGWNGNSDGPIGRRPNGRRGGQGGGGGGRQGQGPAGFRPWSQPGGSRSSKTCRCLKPYRLVNYQCQLECNETEIYADGKCHQKCTDDEVTLESYDCALKASLGDQCQSDEQCTAAFSGCTDGKCACRPGFTNVGKACTPQVVHCEFGEPLRASSSNGSGLVRCTHQGRHSGLPQGLASLSSLAQSIGSALPESQASPDDGEEPVCPQSNYYCQPLDHPARGGPSTGICCPRPKPACPAGEPHATANCSGIALLSLTGGQQQQAAGEECPQRTHYCYVGVGGVPTCCPRPCAQGMALDDAGQCLKMLELGGKCAKDVQCRGNGACIDGTCICPNKTLETSNPRGGGKYCVIQCDPIAEVQRNNKCYARMQLGDTCVGREFRCPLTAHCNRRGVCACPCGTVQINQTLCAPPPSCPQQRRGGGGSAANPQSNGDGPLGFSPKDLGDLFASFFSGGDSSNDAPNGANSGRRGSSSSGRQGLDGGGRRQTQQSPADLYANATLCRIEGRKAPNDRAVDQCPDDQVCSGYLEDMGVCCARPDPFCPNGAPPQGACNPNSGSDCDDGTECFQYLPTVGQDNGDGHVCCPTSRFGPFNFGQAGDSRGFRGFQGPGGDPQGGGFRRGPGSNRGDGSLAEDNDQDSPPDGFMRGGRGSSRRGQSGHERGGFPTDFNQDQDEQ